jgi:hypothetical protein
MHQIDSFNASSGLTADISTNYIIGRSGTQAAGTDETAPTEGRVEN